MSDENEPALVIDHLRVTIDGRTVLREVSFDVARGESLAILGAAGAGKSVLVSAIVGDVVPSQGQIWVNGLEHTNASVRQLSQLRRRDLAVVADVEELVPDLAPFENIALAALRACADAGESRAKARELTARIGVPCDGVATQDLNPCDQRRVAVARALINEPALVVADEPIRFPDRDYCARTAAELCAIPGRRHCGVLVLTAIPEVAAEADRMLVLDSGVIARP